MYINCQVEVVKLECVSHSCVSPPLPLDFCVLAYCPHFSLLLPPGSASVALGLCTPVYPAAKPCPFKCLSLNHLLKAFFCCWLFGDSFREYAPGGWVPFSISLPHLSFCSCFSAVTSNFFPLPCTEQPLRSFTFLR